MRKSVVIRILKQLLTEAAFIEHIDEVSIVDNLANAMIVMELEQDAKQTTESTNRHEPRR